MNFKTRNPVDNPPVITLSVGKRVISTVEGEWEDRLGTIEWLGYMGYTIRWDDQTATDVVFFTTFADKIGRGLRSV